MQDLLDDARLVAINEIRLQEKRVECNGGSTVLQMLLEEGAMVNAPNRDGFTPLMIAARNGRADTLRALLETPGVDMHATNEHGSNAMHYAAMYAHKECVLILRECERELRAGGGGGAKEKLYEARNCLDKTPYDLAMVGGGGLLVTAGEVPPRSISENAESARPRFKSIRVSCSSRSESAIADPSQRFKSIRVSDSSRSESATAALRRSGGA